MYVIAGVRLAGKVDEVPRIGHVATQFFHLYYVPLIPIGTYLVTDSKNALLSELRLPFSFKSILIGWLRTAAWLGLLGAAIMAVSGITKRDPAVVAAGVMGTVVIAGLLVLLYTLKAITQARYERAREIAQLAGLSAEHLLLLEVAYGRLTADQAERELLKQLAEPARPAC